jgi:hypothetical protein
VTKEVRETIEGPRPELITALRDRAEGWDHLGKADWAREAYAALERLEGGAGEVQAGRTLYVVTR